MTAHGHFHWNELMTRDVEKVKAFYGRTLGWTFNEMPMPDGTYTLIMDGEEMVGGMFDINGPAFEGTPEAWMTYVAVDDIDRRIEMLKAEGGTVMREPFDAGDVGRIAMVQIPGGAMQGWMTPGEGVTS